MRLLCISAQGVYICVQDALVGVCLVCWCAWISMQHTLLWLAHVLRNKQ
jgi:hypothetical protein